MNSVYYFVFYCQGFSCLSVSPSLSLYVSLSLCLSVSPSLCLSISPSLCLYVSLYLGLYVSVSPSLCLCLYVSMSLCLYVSVSMSLCLSVSPSLCEVRLNWLIEDDTNHFIEIQRLLYSVTKVTCRRYRGKCYFYDISTVWVNCFDSSKCHKSNTF